MEEAFCITAQDLSYRGQLPEEAVPSCNLVYSSPGTLSYNSPGALGFGVKRAALVIPESVMLLVAPDCCGRNSTILSENEGYAARMFYLRMRELDIVTGGHLRTIGDAVQEVCLAAYKQGIPCKVVVICVTCVDALLGTDVERVCCAAEAMLQKADDVRIREVRVVSSYMYALTREGHCPPMTAIRDTIYSLLNRQKIRSDGVNLMGFFSPLSRESELFKILESIGLDSIREVSVCKTLEEYMQMGEANFNIVLNGEALYAAEKLRERLGIPYLELVRLYDTKRIAKQYRLFAAAVGSIVDEELLQESMEMADKAVEALRGIWARSIVFAIGQMINASPFELSLSLVRYGFDVPYIIATPSETDWAYIKSLAVLSPQTKIYPPTHPTMALFDKAIKGVDIAVGKDIEELFPDAASVAWNSEKQPFGFQAVRAFFDECTRLLMKTSVGAAQ